MGHYDSCREYDNEKLRRVKEDIDAKRLKEIKKLISTIGVEGVLLKMYNKELNL